MAEQGRQDYRKRSAGHGGGGRRPRGFDPSAFTPEALKSVGNVFSYMWKRCKGRFLLVMLCVLVGAWTTLQATLFTRTLIDDFILPMLASGNRDMGPLRDAILGLVVLVVVSALVNFAQQRLMVSIGQGTIRSLRLDLFRHMETLPIRYFDTHTHGEIMSVYTNDIDTLRQVLGQTIPNFVSSLITIVLVLGSMLMLSVPLTLLAIVMVVVQVVVMGMLGGASAKYFGEQQRRLGEVNGYIEEMVTGQRVVKVFCREERCVEEFQEANHELRDVAMTANRLSSILMPLMMSIGNVSYVLCAIAGSIMAAAAGLVSVGTLASFLSLNRNFSQPVTGIAQQATSIALCSAGAQRVLDLLAEEPEIDDGYVTLVNARELEDGSLVECEERTGTWAWRHPHRADGTVTYVPVRGDLEMVGVDFGYDPAKQVLYDVTVFARPGQKVAFVGATGAGKTTITNLINRFYDVEDGKVRYDGINVNKIRKADLRRSLGIVLQDPHLFSGTVMDNIRYGRLDATDEECIAAAKLVSADDFIRRLPQGYETQIQADGGNLSQGQRQLLTIARAAVADPPALILDEATSSVDTRTEQLVQRGMDALMGGRTTFVIAHRLSTVKNADCIMVMDHGRIIERGTHDELIAQKGTYYQLYTGNQIEAE